MSERIKIALLGAGGRGTGFAHIIKSLPHIAEVVAVAEPRDSYRSDIRRLFDLPEDRVFTDWRDFVALGKICDAVIIATMDREHVDPAVACQKSGYHMMLEKPMATSLEDCRKIAVAQKDGAFHQRTDQWNRNTTGSTTSTTSLFTRVIPPGMRRSKRFCRCLATSTVNTLLKLV